MAVSKIAINDVLEIPITNSFLLSQTHDSMRSLVILFCRDWYHQAGFSDVTGIISFYLIANKIECLCSNKHWGDGSTLLSIYAGSLFSYSFKTSVSGRFSTIMWINMNKCPSYTEESSLLHPILCNQPRYVYHPKIKYNIYVCKKFLKFSNTLKIRCMECKLDSQCYKCNYLYTIRGIQGYFNDNVYSLELDVNNQPYTKPISFPGM